MNQRLFFPATERNRKPIGDLLETVLPTRGATLEIASGSGEHAITFQQRFPKLLWQASDPPMVHPGKHHQLSQRHNVQQSAPYQSSELHECPTRGVRSASAQRITSDHLWTLHAQWRAHQ